MIKILPVSMVREADLYTIQHEPVKSVDLMERAAGQCFRWIKEKLSGNNAVFYIYCGPGNNGGDGLALARMLHLDSNRVFVAIPRDHGRYSDDFCVNLDRLHEAGIRPVTLEDSLQWEIGQGDFIIDALFGSGLSKPVTGIVEEVIARINQMQAVVIAIDMPSGLYADRPVDKGAAVVKADYTLCFQFPKQSLLFMENELYAGNWEILPIGLHQDYIQQAECNSFLLTAEEIRKIRKPRRKFSHKGTYGHALLIAGSHGKMGAAVLSSRACMRSGVGLLTSHVPGCGYQIMQTAVPEAMISMDPDHNECSRIPVLAPYSAVGIGPGLGTSKEATNTVRLILQEARVPMVLDADALNILSEQRTWQAFIPSGSILTPHPGEFERLVGKWNHGFELMELLRDFAFRLRVYIVLKGAHTIVCSPGGNCFFNTTGNPGMATGGSGDVLTGIILGLLAQHYSPIDACILGVYLHGKAGDLAASKHSQEAMTAGDIIEAMGKAFQSL